MVCRGSSRLASARTALAFVLLVLAVGCAPADPPNLVLVVIDTLRADHLGVYGYPRPTSPRLDELGRGGVVFTNAVAPSSWTKPSVASLFTSHFPSEHGAVSFDRHLGAELPTLAELLRDAGYRTVGVSANPVHVGTLTGLSRGFEVWEALMYRQSPGASRPRPGSSRPPPRAVEVNRRAAQVLPAAEGPPLFLYVHYVDPHAPYDPPPAHRVRFLDDTAPGRPPSASSDYMVDLAAGRARADAAEQQRIVDLYDGEIAAVDEAVGRLVDSLRDRYGDALVVTVVADHGEEFLEHGGWVHGLTLHRESLAVPFLIRDFRRDGPGSRRDEPVDLLDVPTTLLDLAGVRPPPGMRGRALLSGAPHPSRDLLAELHDDARFEERVAPRRQRKALLRWPWKVILDDDGERAIYRIDEDPGEREPLSGELQAEQRALLETLATLGRDLPDPAADSPGSELDPESLEALRALGYVE